MPAARVPPVAQSAEALPTIVSSGGEVFVLRSGDGVAIRGARWPAAQAPGRGTAMFLQGRTEFIEKNLETIGELRRRGLAVVTFDWRGQGLSGRLLEDRHKGHVADFGDYLRDLETIVAAELKDRQGPAIMLAHSMGAHIGLRFLHDHPGLFDRAVLCAPMIGIRGGFAARLATAMGAMLGGPGAYAPTMGPYGDRMRRFEGNPLTSDRDRFIRQHAHIAAEPRLALGGPTLGWLAASLRSMTRLRRDARAIRTPVLIVSAGEDKVVANAAQRRLQRLMPDCRLVTVAGGRHELLCEGDALRRRFWDHFDAFVSCSPL